MRIDAHSHIVSQAYLDAVPIPNAAMPPAAPLEALEAMMERYAIDRAVVSTGPPGVFFGDQGQTRELTRMVNEEMAAVRGGDPDRFATLGMLPLPDVDAAVSELAHVLDDLGLDGVTLLTQVAGTYLGDPALEPLYAELDRRGAYVFVHPTFPPNGAPLDHPVWLYEFPFETVRAVTNLIYSGTLERYPDIRWQLPHLGGAVPFLAHRIASLADREPALAEGAPAGALAYLSRLYYDTGLANDEIPVRATLALAPADHVLFGSDWPYLALPDEPGDAAPGLAFLGEERAAIDAANIGALVPRWA
jgi:6-methylsalicylate decarboxylase